MKKKNILIIVAIVIVIVLAGGLVWYFMREDAETKVKHQQVENVYQGVESSKCTNIDYITENKNSDDLSDESISYLLLNNLKKEKKLNDSISVKDLEDASKNVFGKVLLPEEMKAYLFDGYTYTLNEEEVTREKSECPTREYVSKLYGYSSNEEELEVDVRVGYVENDTLYDMNGKELGDYSSETVKELLDQSTLQVYRYARTNDSFHLTSVDVK